MARARRPRLLAWRRVDRPLEIAEPPLRGAAYVVAMDRANFRFEDVASL